MEIVSLLLIVWEIGIPILFLILFLVDRSENGSIEFEIPIPYVSREVVFLILAIFWPVIMGMTIIDYLRRDNGA